MKNVIFLAALTALSFSNAVHAAYVPGWERPLKSAEMKVIHSRFTFQKITSATVTLTRQDGSANSDPTGIAIEYSYDNTTTDPYASTQDGLLLESPAQQSKVFRQLVITSKQVDNCGAVLYTASVPKDDQQGPNSPANQTRFSIQLVDRSNSICENNRNNIWSATVRSGYGWCGTMDSTMSLIGNPQPIATIQ